MNLFRKIYAFSVYPKQQHKTLVDFLVLTIVCFLIVVYKVMKS